MTKTLIIYVHPYEKSFNHAILQQVEALLVQKASPYEVIDLYEDGFNPAYSKEELALFNKGQALDPLVFKYQEALAACSRLIMIFPVWWADMPAIVKGFEDKVFLKNKIYQETKTRRLVGRLTNIREVLVLTTSAAPTFYLKLFCGNVIKKAMLGHTFKAIGASRRKWLNFGNIGVSTAEQRQAFLDKLANKI